MSEAELRDFLINKLEEENENIRQCKDQNSAYYQNSAYFGQCLGAAEAYQTILEALDQ